MTSAEGFIGGYWLDPVDAEGFGFVLFETAEQARRATPPAVSWAASGVEILDVDNGEEAETLFDALSDGGDVMMPLAETEWAEKYGMCTDKFGVRWQLNYTGDAQVSGDQEGGT